MVLVAVGGITNYSFESSASSVGQYGHYCDTSVVEAWWFCPLGLYSGRYKKITQGGRTSVKGVLFHKEVRVQAVLIVFVISGGESFIFAMYETKRELKST